MASPNAAALPPLLVIAGPTATGKTGLAVQMALRFEGEIVGADARQVYRGLDIGTGKASLAELQDIPHHLLDVAAPDESFTVTQYAAQAIAVIGDIHRRGKLPILTGGTGFYIRAVVDGLLPPEIAPQPVLRAELERRWQADRDGLIRELVSRDPVTAERIDRQNPRRVIRALEVIRTTGRPFSEQQRLQPLPVRPLLIALTADRSTLYRLADERIEAMFAAGLEEEVRRLLAAGYDFALPAFSAVGYREMAACLAGDTDLEAVRRRVQQATHAYQRRQLTWLRPDPRWRWLDVTEPEHMTRTQALVKARFLPW